MKIQETSAKERILQYIDYLSVEQLKALKFVIDLANKPLNKHQMAEFIKSSNLEEGKEILSNYDTAYPINYFREIEQIYPNISKGNFVYDYSNLSFGNLVNLNDLFFAALYKIMNQ